MPDTRKRLARDQRQLAQYLFHGQDTAFYHGDAAMLADCAEARSDVAASAPGLETVAPELAAPVTDQMLRPSASRAHCPAEKGTHLDGTRLLYKDRKV